MDALLIVDMQNDFMPKGALPVAGADRLASYINAQMDRYTYVVASQDFHPHGHMSFTEREGQAPLWPVHCVQGTKGAQLVDELDCNKIDHIIQKGCELEIDSYSAFFDNDRTHKTPLDSWLKNHGVKRLCVVGVATEYCVKWTVLDALKLGYDIEVDCAGIAGIELQEGDCAKALEEMRAAGAKITVEV